MDLSHAHTHDIVISTTQNQGFTQDFISGVVSKNREVSHMDIPVTYLPT